MHRGKPPVNMGPMNHLAGKFIVFDGTEGCGKSTQAKLFFQTLESARTPALLVRDPGTTRIGEQIRDKSSLIPPREEIAAHHLMDEDRLVGRLLERVEILQTVLKGRKGFAQVFQCSVLPLRFGTSPRARRPRAAVSDPVLSQRSYSITVEALVCASMAKSSETVESSRTKLLNSSANSRKTSSAVPPRASTSAAPE